MYFSRDTQPASKGLNSKIGTFDKSSFKELSNSAKRTLEETELEDFILKKRKLLGISLYSNFPLIFIDDKAPGLFDHLSKFAQEETSTEAASVHSPERDSEEHKHMIHIPTPIKDQNQQEASNLSNTVKVNPQKQPGETFPLPNNLPEPLNSKNTSAASNYSEIEEMQRQKILHMITYNTIMLNSIMSQQKNSQRTLFTCIEAFKNFK